MTALFQSLRTLHSDPLDDLLLHSIGEKPLGREDVDFIGQSPRHEGASGTRGACY